MTPLSPSPPGGSRERILQEAEALILERGFVGTTIDDILDKAAITKGGFFYHFNGKIALARALVDRYIEQDTSIFLALSDRADELSEDPLQQTLIFLKLVAEMVAGLSDVHPGCLVAAFVYEVHQLDEETRQRMHEGILSWRDMMMARLREVERLYPPRIPTSVETLGDMFTAIIEGGIILARLYRDNRVLIQQVNAYRDYLRLLYGDAQ